MKYLITGGCGFLGSNLSAKVIEKGEELFVLDNLYRTGSRQNLQWLQERGIFTFFHSDIRSANDVEIVIREIKPDVVFHLAGQVAMTTSVNNPRLDFEVNTLGTFNLLEAIRKYSPESIIIYSSTNKVYGDLEWIKYKETKTRYIAPDFPNGFDELLKLDFHSPYGCSKGAADQYLLDYYRMYGIRTVVFRHSSMYGGRQFATYEQGWVGWFVQKALEIKNGISSEPFTISGSGKQVRDILYIDDVVNLYLSVANNIGKLQGRAFNVGGGVENSLSLLELFKLLEERLDIKMNYVKLPPRRSDQKVFIADITKIRRALNWKPKINIHIGIKNMIDFVKQQNNKR